MDAHNPLLSIFFFLAAAVIAVPLFRKIKLGAILGYLVAGVLLGPSGFNFISHPESILHFSEIGVVLLLFVIGLELEPEKLWSMRKHIAGLGLGQLLISAAFIFAFTAYFVGGMESALVIGLVLGLSSTAFAIQLMTETGVIASPAGRRGFSILLLQDLAVIPILFLVGTLSVSGDEHAVAWYWSVGAVVLLLLLGRFALNPVLKLVSRYGSRETMTAAALLIVVGAAALMYESGLSMGMGAFIAGIMLANSSFRHQLESDIEPFKGITLGLFFIAIGMTLDISLFLENPFLILLLALALMAVKTGIICVLMNFTKVDWRQGLRVGLMLSQGGEFAFVVMAQASAGGVVDQAVADQINLIVGLSMALTSPLLMLLDILIKPQSTDVTAEGPSFDEHPEVVILGFGRFGQATGRILAANHIPFVAIDRDAEHISFVERFGNKVHYGDACRLDVLRAAGVEHAKVALVGIDDANQVEVVSELIRHEFPHVKLVVRARNRAAYWALKALNADHVIREMFASSLDAASSTLEAVGFSAGEALRVVDNFKTHDLEMLESTLEDRDDIDKLIDVGRKGRSDLERLFNQDQT